MAVNFVESPKKKKISKSILDNAVLQQIESSTFTITIDNKDGKSADVVFYGAPNVVQMKMLFNLVRESSIEQWEGLMIADPANIALVTAMFIIEHLSSLSVPTLMDKDNDGITVPDMERIAVYDAYFNAVSEEYSELRSALMASASDYCKMCIEQYRVMAPVIAEKINVSDVMTTPEVLDIVREAVAKYEG